MLGALCRCPVFLSRSGSGRLGERGACCTVGFIVQPGLGSLSVKTPECWAFSSGCSQTILMCVAQTCPSNHQPCVSSPLCEDTRTLGILQRMQSNNTDVCCSRSLSQQPSAMCLQSSHAADTTLLSPNWPVQPCLNSCPAPDTVLLLVLSSQPAKPLFSLVPAGSRYCESCSGVKQHNNQFSSVCTCLK